MRGNSSKKWPASATGASASPEHGEKGKSRDTQKKIGKSVWFASFPGDVGYESEVARPDKIEEKMSGNDHSEIGRTRKPPKDRKDPAIVSLSCGHLLTVPTEWMTCGRNDVRAYAAMVSVVERKERKGSAPLLEGGQLRQNRTFSQWVAFSEE